MGKNEKMKQAQQADVQQADVQQADVQQADVQQADVQQADVQQADAQQADAQQATAIAEYSEPVANTVIEKMLSLAPAVVDEKGNRTMAVMVGQQAIEDVAIAKAVVNMRTIAQFTRVSSIAGAIEMGQLTKEDAKKEHFTGVKRMLSMAVPSLSESRIMEMYTVGRIFGDIDTHEWRSPIPKGCTITALSQLAKAFVKCDKLDEATEVDVRSRFDAFVAQHIADDAPYPIDPLLPLTALREAIKQVKKDMEAPSVTFTEVGNGQQDGKQDGQQDGKQDGKQAEQQQTTADVREALNLLFTFFAGNADAQTHCEALVAIVNAQEQAQQAEQAEQAEQA